MMDYSKLLQAILDIAEEMLVCGAEVERVEDSIERMCAAYGCEQDRVNAFIITSNIQVTFEDPNGNIITQIRRIVRSDTNFDRLDYLNDLSRYICANTPDLDTLKEKYEEVMNRRQLPKWVQYLGAVMAAGGFSVFFGGNIADGLYAAALGIIITAVRGFFSKYESNAMALMFISSIIAGTVAVLSVPLGISVHIDKVMIGGIMLLIPGIAVTNSIRDMLAGDIGTGLLRFANSVMLAAAIACGFALPMILSGGTL